MVLMDNDTIQLLIPVEAMVNAQKYNVETFPPVAMCLFFERSDLLSNMTTLSTGHFVLTTTAMLTCSFPCTLYLTLLICFLLQ